MFDRKEDFFLASKVQPDIPYVKCLVDLQYLARLSTRVGSLEDGGGLSNQVHINKDFDLSYNVLPILVNLGRWERNFDFQVKMQSACRPVLAGWHSVETFLISSSGSGSLYRWGSKC